ncbi:MAG: hypothetical protein DRJ39_03260 [Thermoprotei archaeon]|nr:MAG: hypothetical protein DRJ39_03260 [Thermoprotei archaeon]
MEYPYISLEESRKFGVFELFGLAFNIFKENLSLSLPSLISSGTQALQSLIVVFALLYIVETYPDLTAFEDILTGNITGSLLIPEALRLLAVIIKFFFIGVFITTVLRNLFYSAFLYPYAYRLLKGEKISFFKCWNESIIFIRKLVPAVLVVEGISTGIPIIVASLIIDKFLELARIGLISNFEAGLKNEEVLILITAILALLIVVAIFTVVAHFIFIFVYQIIIVEKLDLLSALAKSLILALKNFVNLIIYGFLEITLLIIILLVSSIFQLLHMEISEILQFVLLTILSPIFSVVLLGIYLQATGIPIRYEPRREYSLTEVFLKKLNQGLSYLKNYLRFPNLKFIISTIAVYFLGFFLGLEYSKGPLGELLSILLRPREAGFNIQNFPCFYAFSGIFAHNWLVSFLTAFSGILYFPLPLANCLFNGVLVGTVFGLVSPFEFAVAVLPHGFIEIPSFIIATSLGVKLGVYILLDKEKAGVVSREVIYVLIGLAPFFLISALIEALLTPLLLKFMGMM